MSCGFSIGDMSPLEPLLLLAKDGAAEVWPRTGGAEGGCEVVGAAMICDNAADAVLRFTAHSARAR